mgnify:CR=1 FL=1
MAITSKKLLALFALSLALFAASPAFAGGKADEEISERSMFSRFFDGFGNLGVGVVFVSNPEFIGSDGNDEDFLPLIQGQYNLSENDSLYLRGAKLGYAHAFSSHLQAGIETTTGGSRDEDEDARLAGMGDIDSAVEVGPWVKWRSKSDFSVKGALMFDVAGGHGGYVGDLKIAQKLTSGKGPGFEVYAQTHYASADFADTYFTVTPAQVIAGRPAFNAGSGFYQSDIGASFHYAVSGDIYLWIDGQVQFLHGDAKETSVTFDDTQTRAIVGLGYTF